MMIVTKLRIIYTIALLFGLAPCCVHAQVHPHEGSQLNYRIIGFSIPEISRTTGYTIEIAAGNHNSDAPFKQHTIKAIKTKTTKTIAEVPSFGTEYTWRVKDNATNNVLGELHHFSTLKSNNADTNNFHLKIVRKATRYQDAFVFNDKSKVMYNMKGEPVWFLPDIKGIVEANSEIRDIKVTPQNTITFLTYNMAYEINYDGEVLWRAANTGKISGDAEEHYHHEVTRLSNGHYMALAHEKLKWKWAYSGKEDSVISIVSDPAKESNKNAPLQSMQMGTIIEFDTSGNIVWSWKSSGYYKGELLRKLQSPMGMNESHENAFFFDEKHQVIYVSFKNTYQVLKVKYPEGTVVAAYGGLQLNSSGEDISLFSQQHACKLTNGGYLYLYNNNIAHPTSLPEILMFREPQAPNGALEVLWKYEYPDKSKGRMRPPLTSGGNVTELPDQSLLISSCIPYANIFIVTRDKKILWDASLETWEPAENRWQPTSQYRASMVTSQKKLEQLIWTSAGHQK